MILNPAPQTTIPTSFAYRQWAADIAELANSVRALEQLSNEMGLPALSQTAWHGALYQKLLPQIEREPFLIVAVTGGTNTGKSVIFNHLAGSAVSRSHPNATQTRHPVCIVPREFAARTELAALFPDFQLCPWTSENDPLAEGDDHLLFVRDDPVGKQSSRLLLLDTPDIDGTLKTNWRRTELILHAADVLVCVLTQQKYNDAAIREFFCAAAEADKTVLIVFNMVQWPRQHEVCHGWVAQFANQTGIRPEAVYAAPWDPDAAEQLRLPFYPLSDGAVDLQSDLADLQFDAIKIRSLAGSLRRVLDERDGLPSLLRAIDRQTAEYAAARELLDHDIRKQDVELPDLPRHLVWDEIWKWLEVHRTRFDRWIHGTYRRLGDLVTHWWRSDPDEALNKFRAAELDRLQSAMAAKLDQLERLRRGGNAILARELEEVLAGLNRARLFDELKRRHDTAPLVTDGYRQFIRDQLDVFHSQNPTLVKGITWALVATAAVRPVLSVGLAVAGAHGIEMAAGHWAVSWVGDVAFGTATAAAGEVVTVPTGQLALRSLLGGLFARFYEERVKLLTKTMDDLVLGPVVEKLNHLANAAADPQRHTTARLVDKLRVSMQLAEISLPVTPAS